MATTTRCIRPIATLLAACCIVACGTSKVDPYGRPYEPGNLLAPIELRDCRPSDVDRPARLVSGTRPVYPVEDLLRGRSGTAVIEFDVRADGTVHAVASSADARWFRDHAVVAMRDWQVEPAVRAGRPVAVQCRLLFDYRMESAPRRATVP